jgi:hypothetical protein
LKVGAIAGAHDKEVAGRHGGLTGL